MFKKLLAPMLLGVCLAIGAIAQDTQVTVSTITTPNSRS